MNIVGFTGTLEVFTKEQKEAFTKLIKSLNMQEFHHGDCTGWDKSAHDIIKGLQLPHHVKIVIHPVIKPIVGATVPTGRVKIAVNIEIKTAVINPITIPHNPLK